MRVTYAAASILGVAAIAVGSFGTFNLFWGDQGTSAPAPETALLSRPAMACGQGEPGTVGAVARFAGITSGTSNTFAVIAGSTSDRSSSLVALRSKSDFSAVAAGGETAGLVRVPSRVPALQSCNMYLLDEPLALAYKQAAVGKLVANGLVSEATLSGPGVIWMVADDPTSVGDELVITDVETPLTAVSPGTITTYVTAIDRATGQAIGAALTNWGSW